MELEAAQAGNDSRKAKIQAFDESKLGVKGLLDSGVTKIPPMFYSPKLDHPTETSPSHSNLSIPIIDLQDRHVEVVDQIQSACKKWGFFQVINHDIPVDVLDEMISGIRRFHEQDVDARKPYYSRDSNKKVRYFSNGKLFRDLAASWRDTIAFVANPVPPNPEDIPEVCRDIVAEYSKQIKRLGSTIFDLLSEALGLNIILLTLMKWTALKHSILWVNTIQNALNLELTMGIQKHTDCDFMTILVQDQMGGLQVLHENQWVNVPPVQGALVVNIGDILQIYGPIKELLSEENPPVYKEIYYERNLDKLLCKRPWWELLLATFKVVKENNATILQKIRYQNQEEDDLIYKLDLEKACMIDLIGVSTVILEDFGFTSILVRLTTVTSLPISLVCNGSHFPNFPHEQLSMVSRKMIYINSNEPSS